MNYIICAVCGKHLKWINYTHLKTHGISLNEYKTRYPGCPTNTEEFIKQLRDTHIGKKASDETKKKMSEGRRGKKHPLFGKKHSEEAKKKMSESHKGVITWNKDKKGVSDETRKKMSEDMIGRFVGDKNHNWNGGSSFEPYCPKFNNRLKEKVRDRFNRKCFLCDKTEMDNGMKLSVHHVQYNKECGCDDSLKCEFVPLCMSCHSQTNFSRELWEKVIMTKLKNSNFID